MTPLGPRSKIWREPVLMPVEPAPEARAREAAPRHVDKCVPENSGHRQ